LAADVSATVERAPVSSPGLASLQQPELFVIEPPRGFSLRLRELWAERELAWFLVVRAIKPRYRQTVLGIGWAIAPPFVTMVVFSVFLNRAAGIPSARGIPYPVFSYSGLLIWQYFANATTRGATGLLTNAAFLTKVYFPRLLIPLSTVLSAVFDLAIALLVLAPLMAYYGVAPGWQVLALPGFVVLAGLCALGISLWASAASVRFRDLGLAVPLVVQVWMFATPVVYPVTVLPVGWRTAVTVANPLAPVVAGFRWSLIGGSSPNWTLAASAGIALVATLGGIVFFNRMERTYADEI
jgi:lipopolysaccharide transport system permease protein